MASKLEYYSNLADRTAMMVSGSYQSWTSFLTTVGRLYKYPYHEQLMIYAQRPEATACADYHLWNDRMGRYIRGKGTGIALIDTSGTTPALKYVFDIADTGARKNSRTPFLFEFREEHETAVAAALEEKYSAPKQHTVSQQIENSIHNMLIEYWDDHRQDICDNIDGSSLTDYDEYNIGVSFQNAAEVSATYAILSRCGLDPNSYFEHEDFLPVFDFNTPGSLGVLGAAVSQTSETVLRTIEVTIKRYEREKLTERSQNHEQPDLQNERRLPDSQSDPQRTESAAPGQIRNDAQSVPAGASSGAVEQSDSVGEAVPPSAGSRTDSEEPAGTDDDGAGEGSRSNGSTESIRPDEVGGADELPESTGGGDYLLGADLQLIEEISVTGEQISLFLPESEQIQRIDEAERVGRTPSAFSMPQDTIDHFLRVGGNTDHHRQFVALEFMKQKSIHEIAKVLPEIYQGGYGLKLERGDVSAWFTDDGIHITPGRSARYARTAQILSWEDAAVRIGQLLEEGHFASNVELAEAPGLERKRVAERLVDIERDLIHDGAKVFLPTIAQARGGVFPDEVERVVGLLQDSTALSRIISEYCDLLDAKMAGEKVTRFRIYEAEKTLTRLAEMVLPRTVFSTQWTTVEHPLSFITEDEINAALSAGSSIQGAKGRIFLYYQERHSANEQIKFLKEQYGIGGRSGALPGSFKSFMNYDGKGITLTKPDCSKAEIKWSKVAQHIQELVRSERYFTPEALATFQEQRQAKEKETANTSVSVWAYNGIKEAHPDDIVLFQMGDFYEMYGQDARTVAPFLNLTLTQRKLPTGGTIEMCGFRSYALENSLNLLRNRFSLTVSSVKENDERSTYSLPKLEPPKEIEEPAKIDQTFEYRLLSRLDMDCKYFLGNGMRAERHLWAGNVPEQIAEMRKLYDRLVIKPEWITAEDIDSYERQMLAEPVTPEVKTPESLADRLVQLIQVFEPESYTQTFGISGSEVALVAQVNDALKEPEAVRHYLEVVDSYHDDTDIPELTAMIDGLKAELEALPQEPVIVPPAPTVKITQADVDAAIQRWNGDITSKHSVVRYMREHGQEQSTAAWLALEFGGDPKEPFHVSKEGSEDKVIPWSKIQVRIETLIERERFYTEQEYDNMDDIDPIAIRERLADSGIVDGQLVDEEKLNNNPFIRQVTADVERIAVEEQAANNSPNDSANFENPIAPYSVGQSVYLEDGTEFVIEGIRGNKVELLDHSLLFPATRVESVESFKRLLERYPQLQKEEPPFEMVEDESAEPPAESNIPADPASQMELAKQLISEFCKKEYGDEADFSNPEQVGVAYTTLSDKEIPVQVNVNLVNFSLETLLGDTTLETRQYDTLEDLINQELKFLDFQDLTYVSEEVLEQYPNLPGDEPFDVVVEKSLQEEANSQPNYHATVESVFPAEKNNLPYDVVIEKLHFDDSEPTQSKVVPTPMPPAQNYHITDSNLGVGGAKEKFRRNMDAINLLHELEFEGRQATPEEQEVLAQYVGWGGLADAFDESKANWADEFTELYTTLSPEEYKAARGSTLNAHYTSPTVIKAMYDAIGNLGFQTGNILEPSMGVGNFFGMLPESMAHSRLYGVELDDLTGRIAKQLYPQANITISGFEKTDRKDFFDLAVGNVPFGQYSVNDPAYNKLGFSIHNYFFGATRS